MRLQVLDCSLSDRELSSVSISFMMAKSLRNENVPIFFERPRNSSTACPKFLDFLVGMVSIRF